MTTNTLAELAADERTELLDWVSACQSAHLIDSTPGHRFGGLPSSLDDNRELLVVHVESILAERVRALTAQALPAAEPFGHFKAEPFGWTDCAETDDGAVALYERPQQSAQAPVGWVSVATKAPPHVTLDLALSDGTVTVGEFMSALGWHWDEIDDSDPDADVTHWRPRPTHPAPPASRPQPEGAQA